jgi:hypothetical protein
MTTRAMEAAFSMDSSNGDAHAEYNTSMIRNMCVTPRFSFGNKNQLIIHFLEIK